MKAKKADDPPRTNSQQRYASSQRNRRKIGRNQLESREKGKRQRIFATASNKPSQAFSAGQLQFPPVSQTLKRKPLLPLNLPNVPKKRAADPAAESKTKKKLKPDAFKDDDEIAERVDALAIS